MTYPGAAKVRLLADRVIRVNIVRGRSVYSRSDIYALQPGLTEFDIPFTTTLPDANYVISSLNVNNYTDNRNLIPFIKAFAWGIKSANYFQIKLDQPAPYGTQYVLEWSIAPRSNP